MTLSAFLRHGPVAVLFLVTAAVALVVLVVVTIQTSQMALREKEFVWQVNKLIAADNVDRAAKLCAAGGARPVAVLLGVGVLAILRSEVRPADAVERAKATMAQELPSMVSALMPGVFLAAAAASLTAVLGALVVVTFARGVPWGLVVGCVAPVEALAAWVIVARLGVRNDLVRAVRDFAPGEG